MQQFTTATKTAVIFTMEPVSAAIYGYFVGNEILTSIQLFGAVLIISATLVAELDFSKIKKGWFKNHPFLYLKQILEICLYYIDIIIYKYRYIWVWSIYILCKVSIYTLNLFCSFWFCPFFTCTKVNNITIITYKY